MIFTNENLNCFFKFFNLYIAFDMFLIVIVNVISSTKRSFVLIEFDKIKIDLMRMIKVDDLLKSVEINDNDKRFEDSFD